MAGARAAEFVPMGRSLEPRWSLRALLLELVAIVSAFVSAAESSARQAASGGLLLGSENAVDCLFALDATADRPHRPAKGQELLARE